MDKTVLKELSEEYNRLFVGFSPIPEGFFQMSYSIDTADRKRFFLKVVDFSNHIIDRDLFLKKIKHLKRLSKSLDFIPQILKTKTDQPYLLNDNKCYLLQEYIEGKLAIEEDTEKILELLTRVHTYPIVEDEAITEEFNSRVVNGRLQLLIDFFRKENWFREIVGENYLNLLHTRVLRYKELQEDVTKQNLCYVHKDPLGNAIKTEDRMYIIDWDDLSIAHKEADLWPLIGQKDKLEFYESISNKNIEKDVCEYYALESFFLYYEAYILKYYQGRKDQIEKDVRDGIKDGILGWFESVYKEF